MQEVKPLIRSGSAEAAARHRAFEGAAFDDPLSQLPQSCRDTMDGRYFYLKIYGERNSGTRYLTRVCAANFWATILRGTAGPIWRLSARVTKSLAESDRFQIRHAMHDFEMQRITRSEFGWKHSAPPVDIIVNQPHSRRTLFIILTKHPYSWIQSLYKRPYDFRQAPTEFSKFIREDFPIVISDALPDCGPCNPLRMFRLKALQYKRLKESNLAVLHIRYEDLIQDLAGNMDLVSNYLMRKTDQYANIESDVKQSDRTLDDFRQQYALDAAGASLSEEDRCFVVENVGRDVFNFLGYVA